MEVEFLFGGCLERLEVGIWFGRKKNRIITPMIVSMEPSKLIENNAIINSGIIAIQFKLINQNAIKMLNWINDRHIYGEKLPIILYTKSKLKQQTCPTL